MKNVTNLLRRSIYLIIALAITTSTFGQSTISGVVTDQQNEVLIE